MTSTRTPKAPGQLTLLDAAPRWGLSQYVRAAFDIPEKSDLEVTGQVDRDFTLTRAHLDRVPEVSLRLSMHCVMTWSAVDTPWTGWRFSDLWAHFLAPHAAPEVTAVVFTGLDGAMACIQLEDLLTDDVLLAHSREGAILGRDHGAPYRLVVPELYGYKHIKHVCRIELVDRHVKSPHEPWLMHPRGRVSREERNGVGPGWLTRMISRPFLRPLLRRSGVKRPQLRR